MRGVGGTPHSKDGGARGAPPIFFLKIYVSENAFQAILKPLFSYSITSISGSTPSVCNIFGVPCLCNL